MSDRVRQTLDYIVTRGPNAFKIFLEALVLNGYARIARELDADYVDSEDCKRVIETEGKCLIEETSQDIYQVYEEENGIVDETVDLVLCKSTLSPRPPQSLRRKSQSPAMLIRSGYSRGNSKTRSPLMYSQPQQLPVSVASSQFNNNTSPDLIIRQQQANYSLRSNSRSNHHIRKYSNEEALLILDQEPQLDITWDDINRLELDFIVASSPNGIFDHSRNNEEVCIDCLFFSK